MREARLGREKNETNLASTGASANPVGSPGVGTGLQRCFKLGQEVGSLYSYTWPVTTGRAFKNLDVWWQKTRRDD